MPQQYNGANQYYNVPFGGVQWGGNGQYANMPWGGVQWDNGGVDNGGVDGGTGQSPDGAPPSYYGSVNVFANGGAVGMSYDNETGILSDGGNDPNAIDDGADPNMPNFSPVYQAQGGITKPTREAPGGFGGSLPAFPRLNNIFKQKSPEYDANSGAIPDGSDSASAAPAQDDGMDVVSQLLDYGRNKFGLTQGKDEQTQSFDEGGSVDDQDPAAAARDIMSGAKEAVEASPEPVDQQGVIPDDAQGAASELLDQAGSTARGVLNSKPVDESTTPYNMPTGAIPEGRHDKFMDNVTSQFGVGVDKVKRLFGYGTGADAMPPQQLEAAKQAADPQGQMTENERNRKVLEDAYKSGGSPVGWSALQAQRKTYESMKPSSAAIVDKNPQQAASLANKAFGALPSNESVQFTPVEGGFTATVIKDQKTRQVNLTPDQFKGLLVDPKNHFDNMLNGSVADTVQKAASQQAQPFQPGQTYFGRYNPVQTRRGTSTSITGAPQQQVPQQEREVIDLGGGAKQIVPKIAGGADLSNMSFQQIQEIAKRLPPAKQGAFIDQAVRDASKNASDERSANTRVEGMRDIAGIRGQVSRANNQDTNARYLTQQNMKAGMMSDHDKAVMERKVYETAAKAQTQERGQNLVLAWRTFNDPMATPEHVRLAEQILASEGITPGMAPRVRVPQPGQGAPQPAAKQPPAPAIKYLKENPAMAPQFDQKYGAGAARRILGGE